MLSYRFMQMEMKGNLSSSESISSSDICQKYMVAPQVMYMKMHMLGFMFAPSNKLTLMLMVNLLNNDMDLKTNRLYMLILDCPSRQEILISTMILL